MSTSRVKTLVIVVLVIINAFFLTFIVWGRVSSSIEHRETLEEISGILERNGITVKADDIHDSPLLSEAEIVRDTGREQAIASALLGDVSQPDSGGGSISKFESPTGSAVFSGTGEFTIDLTGGEYTASGDTVNEAKKLLGLMDMQYTDIQTTQRDGSEDVSATFTYNGSSIFDCRIDLIFENGTLTQVNGKYPTGIENSPGGAVQNTAPTAVMAFLSDVKSGNVACSSISDIRSGYDTQFEVFSGKLIPVWQIATDTGTYYY